MTFIDFHTETPLDRFLEPFPIKSYQQKEVFDESALFKGMKSHDADPGGVSLRYQNDR